MFVIATDVQYLKMMGKLDFCAMFTHGGPV